MTKIMFFQETPAVCPTGWYIERSETDHRVTFAIFEEGGATWKDGSPRSALDVEVLKDNDLRGFAGVGWPSTSDKRPALARVVGIAIGLAAEEADRLNNPPKPRLWTVNARCTHAPGLSRMHVMAADSDGAWAEFLARVVSPDVFRAVTISPAVKGARPTKVKPLR
jgi:hypothetical protein